MTSTPARTTRISASLSAIALAAALFAAGCGAGTGTSLNSPSLSPRQQSGGAGSPGGAAGEKANVPTQRLNLFVTAAAAAAPEASGKDGSAPAGPADAHQWATIHKVELLEQDEQRPVDVVFEDPAGWTFDLASLRGSGSGDSTRATLLARSPVSMGRKTTRVRITFGKAFQRFAPGAQAGTTALLAESIARDAEGRPVLTVPLSKPRDLGNGRETLLLSLGLAASAAGDGTVVPVVKEITDEARLSRLDGAEQQAPAEFAGALSDVGGEAPSQTFTLTTGPGRPLAVRLNAATVLTNADGKPSPDLKAARQAVVQGRLDLKSGALVADRVTLYADEKAEAVARARGRASDVAADGGAFVLTPAGQAANLLPTQTAITVQVGPDAVLRSRGGLPLTREALRAALTAKGALAEVEGAYEPATATLTAQRVQVVEAAGAPASREALVQGAAGEVAEDGKTLTLKGFSEWDGLAPAAKGVPVTLTDATSLVDAEGKRLSAEAFFAALKGAEAESFAVRATGLLSAADGKLTATRLQLRPAPPKPVAGPAGAPASAGGEIAKTGAAEEKATAEKPKAAPKPEAAPRTPEL
jgi:hypothetical protein